MRLWHLVMFYNLFRICHSVSFPGRVIRSLKSKIPPMSEIIGNQVQKPKVIFVLGGPGAGKGTQCEKLSNEFGIKHLSAGELLREEQRKPTEHGRIIDSLLKEGKIVPVEISLSLLHKAIFELNWNRYLIDGFPRNWDNLEGWNKQMLDVCELESVLFIDCHEDHMERRILSRGQSSGRDDDNLVSARKRFATFQRESMPVVEHLKHQLVDKVTVINGDGDIDSVYSELRMPILRCIERELVELTSRRFSEQQQLLHNNEDNTHKHTTYSINNPKVLIRGKKASVQFNEIEETTYDTKTNDVSHPHHLLSRSLSETTRHTGWTMVDGHWQADNETDEV